jgi:dihydrofolate reductase
VLAEDGDDFRAGGREVSRFGPPGDPIYRAVTIYLDIVPDRRIVMAGTMAERDVPISASARAERYLASGGERWRTQVRKLVVTQNITVDGSIEMLGDWFDPQDLPGVDNSDLLAELRRQDDEADALVLGRRTFEDFRGYWPQQTDDTTGITDYLNGVRKYVVSSTMTDPRWQNSTILTGDPVEEVGALKERDGREIVVTGSITLCHALIPAGLVDEYRLFTYPVVQGRGRRFFPDGFEVPALRLLDARVFRGGITLSRYAPR